MRVFPDDRPTIALWLGVPVQLVTVDPTSSSLASRRELIAQARPNLFSLRYLEACTNFAEKKYEDALTRLDQLDSDYGARRPAPLVHPPPVHLRYSNLSVPSGVTDPNLASNSATDTDTL